MRWALVVLLAAVVAAAPIRAQCPDDTPPPCAVRPAHIPNANSVAVLPFANVRRDSAFEYLADGLASSIATSLGQVPKLEVRSPSFVRRVSQAGGRDVRALGRQLDVRYVVEGEFQPGGDRIRVAVRLVALPSGTERWADAFTRPNADLLGVQEEVAREVATHIAGALLPQETRAIAARPTRSAEAYDHFLRGNYFLARRAPGPASIAVAEYETAARLDPTFGAALARASLTYSLILDWGWPHPSLSDDSLTARASATASRAVGLDSGSADAWMAQAFALSHEHPLSYQGVIQAMERAVSLDARNAEAWHQYGWFLYVLARPNDAIAALQRALALEPGRAISCEHISRVLLAERRYDEARRWIDSAIVLDSLQSFYYLQRTSIRLTLGDTSGARRDAEASARLGEDYPFWGAVAAARVAVASGGGGAAPTPEGRLLAATRDPRHLSSAEASTIGAVLARAGWTDAALGYLERAQPRSVIFWNWLRGADFDALRGDLRFQRLFEELRPPGAPR